MKDIKSPLNHYSILLAFTAGLVLSGCASSYEQVGTDSYHPEYRIICSDNPFSHIKDCRDRAQELCANSGYRVTKEGEVGRGNLSSLWSLSQHELVINCN